MKVGKLYPVGNSLMSKSDQTLSNGEDPTWRSLGSGLYIVEVGVGFSKGQICVLTGQHATCSKY